MIRFVFDDIPETHLPHFKGGDGDFFASMYTDQQNKILKGRLPEGSTIGQHIHEGSSEIIFILSGSGTVILDGEKAAIAAGDCHYCPQGHGHSLINDGTEDLIFYAVVPCH